MAPFASVLAGTRELYFDDHFRFSTPIASLYAEALRAFHLPLWNPWVLTGTPLVAERGSMVAHPGMLLALLFEPSHAVGVLLVLLLGGLAAGATGLLRDLGVRATLAIGVGAAIGLSGPALSYTGNAPYLATFACWPLVLWSALRLGRGEGSVWAGGLALGGALLGGDLPGALLAALVAAVLFWSAGGRARAAWPRLAAVLAIALVVGAGSWFPVLWALPFSERGAGIAASEAGRWSFHPGEILGFLWPHPLGLPLPRFTFWPFRWVGERLFLHSVWIGAVLSAAALLALRRRTPRPARALVAAAMVLLVAATGEHTPLWPLLRPLFTFVRYPSKLAAPAALLLALGGAVVLERLARSPRGPRNLCLWVAGLAGLGALAGPWIQSWLARRAHAPAELVVAAASQLRLGCACTAALAAAGVLLYLLVERNKLSLTRAASGLSVLLFLDVLVASSDLVWTRVPVVPQRPSYLPESAPRGPRVMRLAEVSLARLPLDDGAFTTEQLRQAALLHPLTNVGSRAGVLEPYGLYPGDLAAAMAELARANPVALAEVTASDLLLAAPDARAPWLAEAVRDGRLVPTVLSPAGAVVLETRRALPRSFVVSAASVVARAEVPSRLARDSSRVLLSRERCLHGGRVATAPVLESLASLVGAPTGAAEPIAPRAWRPGEASYQVALAAPSLLVEVDAFLPGWRVYVDGQEQPVLEANVFGRAVLVPPGEHTVHWRFFPPWVVAFLITSWLGVPLVLVGIALRRPWRSSGRSGEPPRPGAGLVS